MLLIDVDPQFNATQCLIAPDDYVEHLKVDGDTILKVFDRNSRVIPSAVANKVPLKPKNLEEIETRSVKRNYDLLPGNLELYRLEMAPGDGRENRLKNYWVSVLGN